MNDLKLLLVELTRLREQCARLTASGSGLVRQMAAADVSSFDRAIEAIQRCGDADSASVTAILGALRPSGSQIRARVLELAQSWKLNRIPGDQDTELDEEDLFERVVRDGVLVTYADWDSGGPGAGAGRVCVYLYAGSYYSTHDAGLSGPFATEAEACRSIGI